MFSDYQWFQLSGEIYFSTAADNRESTVHFFNIILFMIVCRMYLTTFSVMMLHGRMFYFKSAATIKQTFKCVRESDKRTKKMKLRKKGGEVCGWEINRAQLNFNRPFSLLQIKRGNTFILLSEFMRIDSLSIIVISSSVSLVFLLFFVLWKHNSMVSSGTCLHPFLLHGISIYTCA